MMVVISSRAFSAVEAYQKSMLCAGDAVSRLEPLRSLHATCCACLVQVVATLQMSIKVSIRDGLSMSTIS